MTQSTEQTLDLLAATPTSICCRLPPQLILRLDKRCREEGLNRSSFIRVMLEGTLDEMDKFDQLPKRWAGPK
jgi:metal-responsive CopG/Arc/MetJ family transcriptional regulator